MRPGAAINYTDGSVNHLTGVVCAAFVRGGQAEVFRLPEGSSSTQAELVYSAPTHAVEEGTGPVLVHYDSVPAIRSLLQDPLRDNIYLFTAIQVGMAEMERAGRGVHLNWLPSYAEMEGNEAAEHAAYKATLLPIVTHPISMSISLLKRSVAAAAMAGISRELRVAREAGSPVGLLNRHRHQHRQKTLPTQHTKERLQRHSPSKAGV